MMARNDHLHNGSKLAEHADPSMFDPGFTSVGLAMELLEVAGGKKRAGKTVTMVDIHSLPIMSEEKLKQIVATQIGLNSAQELDEKHPEMALRDAARATYKRISNSLERSATFIKDEMHLPLPPSIAATRVQSWAELRDLLMCTSKFKRGERGFSAHLAYCALIKGAIAALELETRFAKDLEGETNYLQRVITTPRPDNDYGPLVQEIPFSTVISNGVHGTLRGQWDPPCEVDFQVRDKTWKSIMRKYLSKAEANAEEAYKDEIAMRFKLDGRRMGTVGSVIAYLRKHFNIEIDWIANKGVLADSREFASLVNDLKKEAGCEHMQIDASSNPKSSKKKYAVLQLNGRMNIPEAGDPSKTKSRSRSFEIQFVDIVRNPPSGTASDAVYALKKDLTIATRLLGGVKKQWILKQAVTAAADNKFTNMSEQKILDALVAEGFLFLSDGSRGDTYAVTDVWDTWLKQGGMVRDEHIRRIMQHEVNKALKRKG